MDRVYLKIKVLRSRATGQLCLTIVSQPFRCVNLHLDSSTFSASNGFDLRSANTPEILNSGMYVQGSEREYDYRLLGIQEVDIAPWTVDEWLDSLRQAVTEYNEWLDSYYDTIEAEMAEAESVEIERFLPSAVSTLSNGLISMRYII